ncbi:MAG: hypothetical protein WD431_16095 [Cyclobacteriaceae bacterium]
MVYFQSENLADLNFSPLPNLHVILDDEGEEIEITGLWDQNGILYWHRRLRTPVCLTGECNLIDLGIYWYCTGEFLGLEIYGEHLTKTDHTVFSPNDYERLTDILHNDWSKLREYELSELVDDVYEENPKVDGTSGATKQEITQEAVEHAVYTTHTIWHLVHVGEKNQLADLTAKKINQNQNLLDNLLLYGKSDVYKKFVLSLIASRKIETADWINSLVIESLKEDSRELQSLAIESLSKCDYSDPSFLNELTKIYRDFPLEGKMQFLGEFQNLASLPGQLFHVIVQDIENQQDWYVIRVFQLFKNNEGHRKELSKVARKIGETDNQALKSVLMEFQ